MDMLVKLYGLADQTTLDQTLAEQGIRVRRAMAYELRQVTAWVDRQFPGAHPAWGNECSVAFARSPISCMIALRSDDVIGFCCYEVTARNLLGPIGVRSDHRNKGVGRVLLWKALREMRGLGYAYAVIGHVGDAAFFRSAVNAIEIPDSSPGPYPPERI